MISTCLYSSCFIDKGSSGERDFLFKELNSLFPTQNYNWSLATFQLLSVQMTTHVNGGGNKEVMDSLTFYKNVCEGICIQLWKKERVAMHLLCRQLYSTFP